VARKEAIELLKGRPAVEVGEIVTSPGPSAVLIAASNALGVYMKSYSVTPERVPTALGRTDSKGSKKGGMR
jgi:hypothetical protein